MDVFLADHFQKPAPGLLQTSQYRNPSVRPQEAPTWLSCCVATETTGLCVGGHSLGTWEASISLSSFHIFYIDISLFSSDLIGRCCLTKDFINSIPIAGNIQKTDRYAPDKTRHSHHLVLMAQWPDASPP